MKNIARFVSIGLVCLQASIHVSAQTTNTTCGCMDVALVIDNTGSMGPAIDNVKDELPSIISGAQPPPM